MLTGNLKSDSTTNAKKEEIEDKEDSQTEINGFNLYSHITEEMVDNNQKTG